MLPTSNAGARSVLAICTVFVTAAGQHAAAQSEPAPPTPPTSAEEPELRWYDPKDGWFDVSDFLARPHGFLPLVIPITEPALGYGAVVAAAFLDPREEAGHEGWVRPNMTVVGGMLTEDGSDGLFAANSSLWDDGDLQTLIGVTSLGLELDFYGLGQSTPESSGLGYRLGIQGGFAEVRRRMGSSKLWGGLRFAYARTEAELDEDTAGLEGIDAEVSDITVAGPSVMLRYDTLDNPMTPTRGWLSDTYGTFFDDAFGGSRDFQLFQQVLIGHHPLAEDWFLGARVQYAASFGDTPFFARPYIDLRGVPALRYQGEQAMSGELEARWQFHSRWSAVGFGGLGVAWSDEEGEQRDEDAWSLGTGFRYKIASAFGLHMGLDVAWGPEDAAVYVQFGNSWMRM